MQRRDAAATAQPHAALRFRERLHASSATSELFELVEADLIPQATRERRPCVQALGRPVERRAKEGVRHSRKGATEVVAISFEEVVAVWLSQHEYFVVQKRP